MLATRFIAAALWILSVSTAQAACKAVVHNNNSYTACQFAAGTPHLETFNLNEAGEPRRYLSELAEDLAQEGKTLVFAMNAGMYDENGKPIGLYIEDGKIAKKLNRRSGSGNFHLKPNGVFYVKDGKAGVMETEAYAKSGLKPDFASQSGPMLVINGEIHPKLSPNGTSRKRRNGVGVDKNGTVTFIISDGFVTFYDFARVFRDEYASRNALFFDGSVSSLYARAQNRNDSFVPLGPMVGIFEIQ